LFYFSPFFQRPLKGESGENISVDGMSFIFLKLGNDFFFDEKSGNKKKLLLLLTFSACNFGKPSKTWCEIKISLMS
jgi:hypothetical protein